MTSFPIHLATRELSSSQFYQQSIKIPAFQPSISPFNLQKSYKLTRALHSQSQAFTVTCKHTSPVKTMAATQTTANQNHGPCHHQNRKQSTSQTAHTVPSAHYLPQFHREPFNQNSTQPVHPYPPIQHTCNQSPQSHNRTCSSPTHLATTSISQGRTTEAPNPSQFFSEP
jgi:hypothetical protein